MCVFSVVSEYRESLVLFFGYKRDECTSLHQPARTAASFKYLCFFLLGRIDCSDGSDEDECGT